MTTPTLIALAWRPHSVLVASVISADAYTVRRGLCLHCGAMVELVTNHPEGRPPQTAPPAPSVCQLSNS